jgi:hypothetical protein
MNTVGQIEKRRDGMGDPGPGQVMGKPSSGQFDVLKTQLALVLQLLLQLLNVLTRFDRSRADHSTPNSVQAGFFRGVLSGLGHGNAV